MKNLTQQVELINQLVSQCVEVGIAQLQATDFSVNGRTINVKGKNLTYFGNCSYLGLELDDRLKEAAKEGIDRYGLQFSCSRSYAYLSLFEEYETMLSQIFMNKPVLVSPTITLGHVAVIPTIITPGDAIILDHQVHASVKNAAMLAKANGVHIEIVRHNRMDMLENRIEKLSKEYNKIWYMADGVYSMYGDSAPMIELYDLMNRHDQFWCYVDDAHGMSLKGKHGCGYALSQVDYFHDKMIFTTSLAKGYGTLGGAMIFPNQELKRLIQNCGSTMMFSGPLSPSNILAGVASAKIHLSDEIYDLQEKLMDRIRYFILTAKGLRLPLASDERTPIFFLTLGSPEAVWDTSPKLITEGYLLNMSSYPAVPYKSSGLRACVTNHHSIEDIHEMLVSVSHHVHNIGIEPTKIDLSETPETMPMRALGSLN